jgi:hypothetical protein
MRSGAFPWNTEIVVPETAQRYLLGALVNHEQMVAAWRSKDVERRHDPSGIDGIGLFAVAPIDPGTLVAIKPGYVVSESFIKSRTDIIKGSHQQIGPNRFLAGLDEAEVDLNLVGYNHSCDPNAKVVIPKGFNLAVVVAQVAIPEDKEITVDYAVSFDSATQNITGCRCRAANCRHNIKTDQDWKNPYLQQKYAGQFPEWLQRQIDELTAQQIKKAQLI